MKLSSLLAIAIALSTSACARYTPLPIDIEDYQREMDLRPFSSEVKKLAEVSSRKEKPDYSALDGIDCEEAVLLALLFNPGLRRLRAEASLPFREARQATRWADPTVSLDVEKFIEGVRVPWVIDGLVMITLPLSGHLQVERERLLSEGKAKALEVFAAEQTVKSQLQNEWLEWSLLKERQSLTLAYLRELQQALKRAQALSNLGELLPTEARVLLIEERRLSATLLSLSEQMTSKEINLRYLMGLSPETEVIFLPSLSISAVHNPLRPELKFTPQLLTVLYHYRAAEDDLRLQIRRQFPDVSIGGGLGPDQGYDRGLFSLTIPIPLLNKNKREIARAEAERLIKRAEVENQYQSLLSQVAQLENSVKMTEARLDLIKAEIVPIAERQLAEITSLAEAGEHNILLQLETYRSLFEIKLEVLDVLRARGEASNQLRAIVEPIEELSSAAENIQ